MIDEPKSQALRSVAVLFVLVDLGRHFWYGVPIIQPYYTLVLYLVAWAGDELRTIRYHVDRGSKCEPCPFE